MKARTLKSGSRSFGLRISAWLVLVTAAGCATPAEPPPPIVTPALPPTSGPDPAPRANHPTIDVVVDRYNDRVALLDTLYGRGVIELRWVDDRGEEHFEPQINAKLWIDRPRHTALRGEKLGEVYMWLGSDAERYWMFDLVGTPRRLYVGLHDAFSPHDPGSVLVRPVTLLDLIGLAPIVDFDPRAAEYDDDRGRWTLTANGSGGRVRLVLDAKSALPVRIEALGDDGEVVLHSDLARHAAVDLPGMSALALPRMPTLIDIANPAGTFFVKLAFGDFTGETLPRVFDLEGLRRHLRPDVVEGPGAR